MTRIKDNIKKIRQELLESVTLCAVTKYHSLEETRAVIDAGVLDIGENKVQDLLRKKEAINDPDVRWHMIGHLQTNKVKKLIGHTALIHSVDSLKLVDVIEKESAEKKIKTDILLEVCLTGEESKFGLLPDELFDILPFVSQQPHINLKGLMGMGSAKNNFDENYKIFKQLFQLYDTIRNNYQSGENQIDTLSMGMSDDYVAAVNAGATIVRIGSKIFE